MEIKFFSPKFIYKNIKVTILGVVARDSEFLDASKKILFNSDFMKRLQAFLGL